ncbi:response regulator [Ramlibacter humi]|uniref:Adenylate/guanylate cyclase domain-containing response regulator n=1 Tax=Ramlibacter humi TaxID=2530451 RepID=A0A4Z0BJH2_9BURK|nr:response regulator [Ramlibacter humi]TFY98264.1 adenylate/guanylate cyclase domain-containing response regulator [Ramlibacter humi]
MALIVLMEDDAGTRTLIASVLKKDGHEVLQAEDGAQGLLLVEERRPHLVISDVQMPQLNGFQMLAALRQNQVIAATPVILLTSLQERAHMRIGMTTGADDYITKPFRPGELRDAVSAQLNKREMQASLQGLAVDKAVQAALEEQRHQLAKLYEQRLAVELSERWPSGDGQAADEKFPSASVLFVDIPNYAGVAERLNPAELTELVRRFYGSANDTAHLFGARHIQFIGEGVLAVFIDATDTRTVNHGLRAARAALGLVEAGKTIQHYLAATYPGRNLPRFVAHVALHAGPVALTVLHDPLHAPRPQTLPIGDAVAAAMQLQRQGRTLGWPVVASVAALRMVTGAVDIGRRALVQLPGRSAPIDVAEITGLAH